MREALRALFLLESDDVEAVLRLAGELPAIHLGGSVEVWPLIEPAPHGRAAATAAAGHRDTEPHDLTGRGREPATTQSQTRTCVSVHA